MRTKLTHKLTAAVCALALLLALAPPAYAAGGPAVSSNINKQDYTTWSSTVKSYLYDNGSGLTRVEYINGSIVVEDYDANFNYLSGRTIPMELSIWGGFYAGADANYFVFGQNNASESNSTEVYRVVKYSKDWKRQGQASLYGANTVAPFEAGSLRCDEYGGYLYIRTCHKMYASSDGLNHQANVMISVKESDMTIADSYYDVMNISYGYVSHSFNQFIIVDQSGRIITLDHGDAYPRAIVWLGYYADAATGKFTGSQYGSWCFNQNLFEFPGAVGNNTTGGSAGGLEETENSYIMAFNSDGKGGGGNRAVYINVTNKAAGTSKQYKLDNGSDNTTPVLAPVDMSGGYMLWNAKSGGRATDTLYYVAYIDNGAPSPVQQATAPLSDCQPVSYNGMVVWYVTNNSTPVFYGLNASGVRVLNGTASAEPEKPTTPVEPEKPTTPVEPEKPTTPVEPEKPTTPVEPEKPTTPVEPEKPATPPSTENHPEYAVPSSGTYRSGSFGWNGSNRDKEEITFSTCLPRQDFATITVRDKNGSVLDTLKPSVANVAYGSSVQKVQAGISPNYSDTVTLYLGTATFPRQYAVDFQLSGETTTLKTGDTLTGPINGYNAVAMKWDTGRGIYYDYIFYLESKDETPASVQPSAPSTPAAPTKPSTPSTGTTATPSTTTPSTTTPSTTTPATTTPTTTKPSTTTPSTVKNPFTDVPANAYYTDAVLWALEKGVTTGATTTTFEPYSTCTRGQVATFLWRAKGCPEPVSKTNPFTDIKATDYYYKAILWAYEQGITTGDTTTTFDPEGTCTNGQVVTFLWRAENKPAVSGTSALTQPGYYYTDAVTWADKTGLLKDTGAAFDPDAQSPRANIVTYLYRDLAE